MAMKGRGAPEVERVYTRAQELCQGIGDPHRLFAVLWGLFLFHRSRGEIDVAHGFGQRLLALAEGADDRGLLIEAHHALWATLFARGELLAARDHANRAVALYDPGPHASLAAVYGNHDPAVCALGHAAWALELAGEPEEASRQSEDALALARALGHPFSEAHALLYGARLHQFRGDWRTTRDRAEAAAELARDRGFVQLQAWAAMTRGWALSESGEREEGLATMREGIAAIRALGSEDFKTYFLGLLAETLANARQPGPALDVVAEALAVVETGGERFYAAELHRLRGELLLTTGQDRGAVAGCFDTARQIARQQRALALERRALRSLGKVRDLG
jgi:predicted ATPase